MAKKFLVFLYFLSTAMGANTAVGTGRQEIQFPTRWIPILDTDNKIGVDIIREVTYTLGWAEKKEIKEVKIATQSVGHSITVGTEFSIFKLGASAEYSLSLSFETSTSLEIMTSTEMRSEIAHKFTIPLPAGTRCVLWQLYVNVAGHDVKCSKFVINDGATPPQGAAVGEVEIYLRKPTKCELPHRFKLKHVEKDKYLTIVSRKNYPAATLATSGHCLGIESVTEKDYKITAFNDDLKTIQSNFDGYRIMYASDQGGIYFDQPDSSSKKQVWIASAPLCCGAEVQLDNGAWPAYGLSYHEGPATTVYAIENKHDKWIVDCNACS